MTETPPLLTFLTIPPTDGRCPVGVQTGIKNGVRFIVRPLSGRPNEEQTASSEVRDNGPSLSLHYS